MPTKPASHQGKKQGCCADIQENEYILCPTNESHYLSAFLEGNKKTEHNNNQIHYNRRLVKKAAAARTHKAKKLFTVKVGNKEKTQVNSALLWLLQSSDKTQGYIHAYLQQQRKNEHVLIEKERPPPPRTTPHIITGSQF